MAELTRSNEELRAEIAARQQAERIYAVTTNASKDCAESAWNLPRNWI